MIRSGVLLLLLAGCGAGHIGEYEPKRRDYRPLVDTPPKKAAADGAGSLWGERSGSLFTDVRAFSVNDVVTVRIVENATAKSDSSSALARSGGFDVGANAGGLIPKTDTLDPAHLASGAMNTESAAQGTVSKRDDLRFTVAATVTKVLPNGNLFVEGHRVILVNDEENHFYVSGVARPEDIMSDNSIASSLLADAQVEYTGAGAIAEAQSPGWLTRLLNALSPF